jgi:hypothetical protein
VGRKEGRRYHPRPATRGSPEWDIPSREMRLNLERMSLKKNGKRKPPKVMSVLPNLTT